MSPASFHKRRELKYRENGLLYSAIARFIRRACVESRELAGEQGLKGMAGKWLVNGVGGSKGLA
jgi:hypothetical protein